MKDKYNDYILSLKYFLNASSTVIFTENYLNIGINSIMIHIIFHSYMDIGYITFTSFFQNICRHKRIQPNLSMTKTPINCGKIILQETLITFYLTI